MKLASILLIPAAWASCTTSPVNYLNNLMISNSYLTENFNPSSTRCLVEGPWNEHTKCLAKCEYGFEFMTSTSSWTKSYTTLICKNGNWKFMNNVQLTNCNYVDATLLASRQKRNVVNTPQTTKTVYVDANNGNDNNDGTFTSPLKTLGKAGRTIFSETKVVVLPGTYRNNNFGNGHNNGVVMNLKDLSNILVTGYSALNRPVIEFDGAGGISMTNVHNIKITGFIIKGPNQHITEDEALADREYRTNHKSAGMKKYIGRGIVAWSGNHIRIEENEVSYCPNSGIRSNKGDYILITNNKVYGNTWWSSSAESAIVLAEAQSIDNLDIPKMFISENEVYDNENKITYYNPKYDDPAYLKANQMSIVRENYGGAQQDFIIDGQGVYVTRNSESYEHGKFQLSYNVCEGNGINGLVVHKTHRAIVEGNTIANNGKTEKSLRQNYAGLTLNRAEDTTLRNNKVWVTNSDDNGYVNNRSVINEEDSYGNTICNGKINGEFYQTVSQMTDGCN